MLDIEQIRERLKSENLSEVARFCGVTRSYIHAIANMKRLNPSYETVRKLNDYFASKK